LLATVCYVNFVRASFVTHFWLNKFVQTRTFFSCPKLHPLLWTKLALFSQGLLCEFCCKWFNIWVLLDNYSFMSVLLVQVLYVSFVDNVCYVSFIANGLIFEFCWTIILLCQFCWYRLYMSVLWTIFVMWVLLQKLCYVRFFLIRFVSWGLVR
jgi:hypothetical protein